MTCQLISAQAVTIYATQCRHFLSFSFFFVRPTKNLGICEAKYREKEHLEEPSIWDSLRAAL